MLRATPLLALPCLLAGCLTTHTSSTVIERRPTGIESVLDSAGQHLVASEQLEGDQLVLAVSSADRSHDLQGYEVQETKTDGRGWAHGGKAGRNLMFVASAAATWVGLFGVGFETGTGNRIQIGGLGQDGQPASAIGAIVAALGGLGYGAQQTVSTHRSRSSTGVLRQEQDWLSSSSGDLTPLAGQAVDLLLASSGSEGDARRIMDLSTDAGGQARLQALSMPGAAWNEGHELVLRTASGGLEGTWSPDKGLRQRLLAMPADWSTPFHSSLLQGLADLSERAGSLVSPALDPQQLPAELAEIQHQLTLDGTKPPATPASTAEVQGYLERYPPEYQAALATEWARQIEDRLERIATAREQARLDWLRSSMKVAGVNGENLASSSMDLSQLPRPLLTPLFQPGEVFHGLPAEQWVGVAATGPIGGLHDQDSAAELTLAQRQIGRFLLLGPETCALDTTLGPQRAGSLPLRCSLAGGRQITVVAEGMQALVLDGALAWSLFGQVEGLRQVHGGDGGGPRTLLVLHPLYAASLARPEGSRGAFTQILDEQGLLDSGILRLLDPL